MSVRTDRCRRRETASAHKRGRHHERRYAPESLRSRSAIPQQSGLHRGYVANIEESVGAAGSVVTDYRYEQNIHSDSQFLQESIAEAEISADTVTLITDGERVWKITPQILC